MILVDKNKLFVDFEGRKSITKVKLDAYFMPEDGLFHAGVILVVEVDDYVSKSFYGREAEPVHYRGQFRYDCRITENNQVEIIYKPEYKKAYLSTERVDNIFYDVAEFTGASVFPDKTIQGSDRDRFARLHDTANHILHNMAGNILFNEINKVILCDASTELLAIQYKYEYLQQLIREKEQIVG